MVNRVLLIGRLGADPETKYTPDGTMVVNFRMATDESYKNKQGEKVSKTEWHRIVVWGKLAEICTNYLGKGSLVFIEGKLQTRTWDDKDGGSKRSMTEIVASGMKMLDGKRSDGDDGRGPDGDYPAPPPLVPDDDVPF